MVNPSRLLKPPGKPKPLGKSPGSEKRSETRDIKVDAAVVLEPDVVPLDLWLEGFRDFVVQDLVVKIHTTR